ncbi:matrixin family metalloprotease [Dysgonomonas sp. HGC4]|uniref:matrixin family metalloprotease n=1 Tax=Dysgonomonas sp. HGC4 TaxID=1658009 RepID=UPI000682547F|nr:matrixin family metalloprotease [Dysgonomonas sp. HGC4]MBD8347687.1 matrixin family metalloprotease [Dysgonomonas sp. HGC4]
MKSQQLKSQLFKVSIHELGHTMGLPHCDKDSVCYMRDAKGGNPIDELTDFCSSCKSYLRKKGWQLE